MLTNEAGLSRRDRVGKVWSRRHKYDKSRVLGLYHGGSRNRPSYIELRVDKIVSGLSKTVLRVPLLRDLGFGSVLFHEIGHHIHRTIRPEHSEKEDVADSWAGRLNVNFVRKSYWYAFPVLLAASKVYSLMKRRRWIGGSVQ